MCFTFAMHKTPAVRVAMFSFVMSLALVVSAAAQDKGQVGLVVGYPATVGVSWQISDRIAVRGEGSFSWSSSKTEEPSDNSSSTSTFTYADGTTSVVTLGGSSIGVTQESHSVTGTVGVSVLVTLTRTDELRTYIAPRVAWAMSRSTTTLDYDLSGFVSPTFGQSFLREFEDREITTKSRTASYGAAFGAATTLRERFGVFGELGFNYTPTGNLPFIISSSGLTESTRESRTVSLRSGIGVTIYF